MSKLPRADFATPVTPAQEAEIKAKFPAKRDPVGKFSNGHEGQISNESYMNVRQRPRG